MASLVTNLQFAQSSEPTSRHKRTVPRKKDNPFTGEMASLQDPSSKCLASGSGLKPAIARVDIVVIFDIVATTDSVDRDNIGYVQ